MEFLEIIKDRRSIRAFQKKEIPKAIRFYRGQTSVRRLTFFLGNSGSTNNKK